MRILKLRLVGRQELSKCEAQSKKAKIRSKITFGLKISISISSNQQLYV